MFGGWGYGEIRRSEFRGPGCGNCGTLKAFQVHVFPRSSARTEAVLSFTSEIGRAFRQWRVGFSAFIEDRPVQVVQGTNPGQSPVNLYFDDESGLLVRFVRYAETAVGTVPTQIDYGDYREVAGVLMPFRWTMTWTDSPLRS